MTRRRLIAVGLTLLALSLPAVATAQGQAQDDVDRGFSAQNFEASPGADAFLTVEGAQVPNGLGFRLGALLIYQWKPLVIRGCNEIRGDQCVDWAKKETPLVEHHLSAQVLAAISLYQVFEAGLAIPAVIYQVGEGLDDDASGASIDGPGTAAGISDLRLHLKLDLLHGLFGYQGEAVGLAVVPVITFPVGNAAAEGQFMGDSFITVHPKLAFGARMGPVRLGLNGGYIWREEKEFYLAEVGPRISYGAALEFIFTPKVSWILEAFGQNGISTDFTNSPLEGDTALRFKPGNDLEITLGGGAGILAGVGTPAARAFLGLIWAPFHDEDRDKDGLPNDEDACPDNPEDKDEFEDADGCPDLDNDQDGIKDVKDDCPNDPEDHDDYQDDDGCPDPDNDSDGILDADDECPDEAEDKDGFEDGDGCPDPDNDSDGILDADDECPDEAEDKDGFEDGDGCPDPDNDDDGIPDKDDKCPLEAETVNDHEDEDGCPDTKPLAVVTETQIVIGEKIHFDTAKARIKKISYPILDAVLEIMNDNPSIQIRVEGHTDSRGRAGYNRKLSKKRAKAVLKYLVKAGIDKDRLTSEGFGPDKPIAPNDTADGRAENRRVEFHITER